MKFVQTSLTIVVIIFAIGNTYIAIIDPKTRTNYTHLTTQAVTGLFALAQGISITAGSKSQPKKRDNEEPKLKEESKTKE
jgi:hypothetical protein